MPTEGQTDLNPMATVKEGLSMLLALARLVEKVVRGMREDLNTIRAQQKYLTQMVHAHQDRHGQQYRKEYEYLKQQLNILDVRLHQLEEKGE